MQIDIQRKTMETFKDVICGMHEFQSNYINEESLQELCLYNLPYLVFVLYILGAAV